MPRIFLDFLDFNTADHRPFEARLRERELRMRYEILAFPSSRFFVAGPAVAKCDESAYVLAQYGSLWADNRISYVLDPKYSGNISRYFLGRMSKLEHSFDEAALSNHFEYCGYTSQSWRVFFLDFLPSILEGARGFADRVIDGDLAFRQNAGVTVLTDEFASQLHENGLQPEAILSSFGTVVADQGSLFQRESIVARVIAESGLASEKVIDLLHHQLDLSFAKANADAANSLLPENTGQVSGLTLAKIARHVRIGRQTLAELIESLSAIAVVELSQQSEWRSFVIQLNAEVATKTLLIRERRHLLIPSLQGLLPSRRFAIFQAIGAMIVAYIISPIFGSGAATRLLSAIFTDAPMWTMNALNMLTNKELTASVIELAHKIDRLQSLRVRDAEQPLGSFGLKFSKQSGFLPL